MAWEQDMETLARERGPALVGYAFLLTGELYAAQDVVQDALVATFSRRRSGADVVSLEAYVRRAILTTFLNTTRRRRRWGVIAPVLAKDPTGPPDRSTEAVVTSRLDVQAALARLSPRERACVVLRHVEDLTVAQIADHLGLSDGAVKRYLSDARHRLAPLLGDPSTPDVEIVTEGARP